MDAFHTACKFLAVIGKRFSDAGLRDIIIESGFVGSGSVNSVLAGHHYNRVLCIHKVVMEAFLRLKWESSINCYLNKIPVLLKSVSLSSAFISLRENTTLEDFKKFLLLGDFEHIYMAYLKFCESMDTPPCL